MPYPEDALMMPSVWFLGLFCLVVWTVFLLLERAWPGGPAGLLLFIALAAGLAAAVLDQRYGLPESRRHWGDRVLFGLSFLGLGVLYGASFAPWFSGWFSGVLEEPPTSLSSFMYDGPALLILLTIIVNMAHRRRLALADSHSAFASKAAFEAMLGLGIGAVAWVWLPAFLGPAAQPIYVYAFVAGSFAMTVFAWFVPYRRRSEAPALSRQG